MSTHKKIDLICVAVIILSVCLAVLFMNGSALGIETIIDEDSEAHSDSVFFTSNDLNSNWDTSSAVSITLDGSRALVSGSGAYVYGNNIVISSTGCYVVSGTMDNGSIIIDADSSSKVWLLFNGADISCENDACIKVLKADKVFLTLADGTSSSLKSGSTYSEEALNDKSDGVIFSKDDLTINGSGALNISGGYKHGISVNDSLVITGGNISIESDNDCIHAHDSLRITSAELNLTAADKGIALSKSDAYFYFESGKLVINAGDDAISVPGELIIAGGEFELCCTDDAIHCDNTVNIYECSMNISKCYEGIEGRVINIYGGTINIFPSDDGINAGGESYVSDDETSLPCVNISGGNISIINESAQDADGIDSNGDIIIDGGNIFISLVNDGSNNAIDYGSENGGTCLINGGTIVACGSYRMAEGFDASSTQPALMYTISYGLDAGTPLCLEDADGNALIDTVIPCSFSCAILSCPELKLGETYLLIAGDDAAEITLDSISASYGNAQSTMFNGPMNDGQLQNIGHFGNRPGGGHGGNMAPPEDSNADDSLSFPDNGSSGLPDPNNENGGEPFPDNGSGDQPAPNVGSVGEPFSDNNNGNQPSPPDSAQFNIAMPGGRADNNPWQESPASTDSDENGTHSSIIPSNIFKVEYLPVYIISAAILAAATVFAAKFKRRHS